MPTIKPIEGFKETYNEYGYKDFQENLYKQYYKKSKNIVFESNLNRINHSKINKIGDYEIGTNYINFITNYPYSPYNYTNRGIIGLTETESINTTIDTYSYIFEELLKQEEHSNTILDNFNTIIIIDKEQFKHNKENNKSLKTLTIKFSIYEIPELEYLNTIKEIAREFFYKYIEINWTDENAYGKRGEYMPFKWGLTWRQIFKIEKIILEYLNDQENTSIPFIYWAHLNGYTTDSKERTETLTDDQASRLSNIIDQLN